MDARSRSRVNSARASRVGSRTASTRTSRRNSGTGADELGMSGLMMTGNKTDMVEDDYFGAARYTTGEDDVEDAVDAIHAEEDEGIDDVEDEEEVARLMNQKAFGLGSVVDHILAWTGVTAIDPSNTDIGKQRHEERVSTTDAREPPGEPRIEAQDLNIDPAPEEGSFKDDILWLLGVAGKILF